MRKFMVVSLIIVCCLVSTTWAQQPDVLRIGYIPIADCAQLYVAIEKGFFQEENLQTELVKLAGGAKILEALAGGSVDVGFSNVISLILTHEAKLGFVAITGGPIETRDNVEHKLLVAQASGIKTPQDLEGKRIALNTRKNIDELMASEYVEKYGVDLQSIQFVEMPFPRMENVLRLGEVDAIAVIEPFMSFALKKGDLLSIGDYYTELYPRIEISSYNVSKKWLDQHQEIAQRFYRAFVKSTEFCEQHPEQVREILAKYTNLTLEQLQDVTLPFFGATLDPHALQSIVDRVYKRGWIRNSFDVNEILIDVTQ